jgi:peptidoglycan hydrolase-like protein with peptidoglycan-binding domain
MQSFAKVPHSTGRTRDPQRRAIAPRSHTPQRLSRAACACGGPCPRCRAEARTALMRPKPAINTPANALEHQADRIADPLMPTPDHRISIGAPPRINRKCEACERKDQDKQELQLKPAEPAKGTAGTAPPIVHEVLRAPSQPLDPATRAFMEPRFGHDFSQVRVHNDAKAAESARAVNARAYTVGEHVVFEAGEFTPTSHTGQHLLAHELAHVVQQSNGRTAVQHSSLAISTPDDASEREADHVADAVMGGSLQTGDWASGGSVVLNRTIGDGHDLQSPRFAGDDVLEGCFDNERLLQFGSRGPAVEKLQQALVDAGFPLPVFGVDGIFESETQGAVRDYQRAHGLGVDGIVGPITMGELDAQFSAGPSPGPAPAPPAPAPPGPAPAPPGPAPAPPGPAPAPPGPAPAPPGPAPAPPGPSPSPPTPAPPAEAITSSTVEPTPGAQTRTTIGVGEKVNLTHSPGSAAWTTTVGTAPLSATNGVSVIFSAPDVAPATTQTITVTAGAATLAFTVLAPTSVTMDREPGTGIQHTVGRPNSGIQTRVFLGPDTVNFSGARYRELDVNATATVPGAYSCFAVNTGHCGAGGGGAPCPDKALTSTVVAGMGTQSLLGDCACSGDCATAPPFVAGNISFSIPYEYKVGTGAFTQFTIVPQLHTLAADLSTLTSSKGGTPLASTTVASGTVTLVQCPGCR